MIARGKVKNLRDDRGQAMVEFVIVLPLLLLLVYLIVFVGIGFQKYIVVTDAARAGARAAGVARYDMVPRCDAAQAAVEAAAGPPTDGFLFACNSTTTDVTVEVSYNLDPPSAIENILGSVVAPIEIKSSFTQPIE